MNKLTINDLPKEVRDKIKKENGISTKKYPLTKNDIRCYSISVLNVIKGLTKNQRQRVLKHSLKVNEI